ncbi:DUF397 domain-containing protein [Streptomyces sp. NPDC087425]|uniref:DUF397 domain-containing protein n=1 Tax=Streptomyces sp. NPDC087425 TaxID=3365787 RepID=UPI0038006C6F
MSQRTITDASAIDVSWQKSSASGHSNDCVELAHYEGAVAIRDSKKPHGPAILSPSTSVAALIAGIKSGELDHLAHGN